MVDAMPLLPGLSPVRGKAVVARFDGGRLSSEGGLLALREIERRLGMADRLATCLNDPRAPEKVQHRLAEIIRFRMLMIAAGYEDGNDADALRRDPMFKLALDRLPSGEELCSQSTISRLENLPDIRALLRLGRALIDQYCASFRQVPKRIVLDIDDTFDRVHGDQQLRLFNAYHDDYGFQPIVVFDGEGRFVTALLRRASGRVGVRSAPSCAAWCGAIRAFWPRVEILLRADSHYAAREVFDWCRANRVDWVFGLTPNAALRRHITALERAPPSASGRRPSAARCGASRNSTMPPSSWSRVERIIARVEAGPEGTDTRFIVTNLAGGRAKHLYQGAVLRPRPGREPHQGVEEPSRRRPHLLPRGSGQPVPPVPARRRLLAHVVAAPLDAERLGLARHAIRHSAIALSQACRPRRRAEKADQNPPAVERPRSGDLYLVA